jgi:hypothetical protein
MKIQLLLCSAIVLFSSCKKQGDETILLDPVLPKPADPAVLRMSPETLLIENNTLILDTYVWRDFMPISPPDGQPMICSGFLKDVDSLPLVGGIIPTKQHVIFEDQVWSALPSEINKFNDFSIEYVTRNGPKWGPDIYVDVVIEFTYKDSLYSIQDKMQYVEKTQ